jgi:zinc D-Ala-D-Ala carboxypeptidase
MMYLSANFTLSEFTDSQIAARQGIDNNPPDSMLPTLRQTAYGLELVRTLLNNKPILISSGYRSAALNAAAGGAQGSQHLLGEACDFTCPTYGTPEQIVQAIVASKIPFDQVIHEFGRWVHISFGPRNRRQALTIDKAGTRPFK